MTGYAYQYDVLGRPVSRNSDTFAYDRAGQVVGMTRGGRYPETDSHAYGRVKVASYTYDAFGNILSSSGAMRYDFHYLFSTKYQDPSTWLYDFGYRWYFSEIGRWLNRDPIAEGGGHNLHLFVFNSPQYSIDVLGNEIYYFVGKSYLDENEQKIGENKDAESFEKVMILNALESSNNSTKRTKQDEFHITYSKFASIDTLISLIKKANANGLNPVYADPTSYIPTSFEFDPSRQGLRKE